MSWCLRYWRDVLADFRAFYRLSPAEALALPGPELMLLVFRLPVFQGVIAARHAQEEKAEQRRTGGAGAIPATSGAVAAAGLSDLIEIE